MKQQVYFSICTILLAIYGQAQSLTPLTSLIEEPVGDEWKEVNLKRQITHAQPMTGIAVWPWKANEIHSSYGRCIQLEFNYFKPSEIVKGCNNDGTIIYDWSSFDNVLSDVASRGHQLVARFYYEYPGSPDKAPEPTVVPQYIKQLSDYNETYSQSAGTYYADWSNAELQRFTIEFYTAFAERYAHDPRLAFLEVGFGHWSEYHIFPTTVVYGKIFLPRNTRRGSCYTLVRCVTGYRGSFQRMQPTTPRSPAIRNYWHSVSACLKTPSWENTLPREDMSNGGTVFQKAPVGKPESAEVK
ncbi:MAG: hypothetical protein IJX44_08765 [Bacteroidaceae bacterium]|nr:hypothetical protein [Bacteroidaceae bacterium]